MTNEVMMLVEREEKIREFETLQQKIEMRFEVLESMKEMRTQAKSNNEFEKARQITKAIEIILNDTDTLISKQAKIIL